MYLLLRGWGCQAGGVREATEVDAKMAEEGSQYGGGQDVEPLQPARSGADTAAGWYMVLLICQVIHPNYTINAPPGLHILSLIVAHVAHWLDKDHHFENSVVMSDLEAAAASGRKELAQEQEQEQAGVSHPQPVQFTVICLSEQLELNGGSWHPQAAARDIFTEGLIYLCRLAPVERPALLLRSWSRARSTGSILCTQRSRPPALMLLSISTTMFLTF